MLGRTSWRSASGAGECKGSVSRTFVAYMRGNVSGATWSVVRPR